MKQIIFLISAILFFTNCVTAPAAKSRHQDSVGATSQAQTLERQNAGYEPGDYFEAGEKKVFRLQIFSASVNAKTGRILIGGALYKDGNIYRALLLSLDVDQIWHEETPIGAQTAFVFVTTGAEEIAVESIFNGGSLIQNFWHKDANGWSGNLQRESQGKDVFKEAVGCCTETVNSLSFKGNGWLLNLSGEERAKMFSSVDKGKTWKVLAVSPFFKATDPAWIATNNEFGDAPEANVLELRLRTHPDIIRVPRYWTVDVSGSKQKLAVAK